MGGDIQRGKIRFFGNNMDFDYGPGNENNGKTLITLTKDGVDFKGPGNFDDIVTFSGPIANDEENHLVYEFL